MAEVAILLAVGKISAALGGEIVKLSRQLLVKEVSLLVEFPYGVGRIKSELLVMKGFFSQIDMRDRNNQALEAWIGEVRKLAYRIEDIMDEYVYVVAENQGKGLCGNGKKTQTLVILHNIATELKEIEINLANLWKIKGRWVQMASSGLGDSSTYVNKVQLDQAISSQLLDEEELVGKEKNKEDLINLLLSNGITNLRIITVWGMGGLGKTTLVSNVYKTECHRFECYAWVSVSRFYYIDVLLRKLIKDLYHKKESRVPLGIKNMDTLQLKEHLKSFLEHKRFLIILDDVWTRRAFEEICGYFVENVRGGGKIIITTRIRQVASLAHEHHMLELHPLVADEACNLLFKTVFGREQVPTGSASTATVAVRGWLLTQLTKFVSFISNPYNSPALNELPDTHNPPLEVRYWGEEIVKRCRGLPLAIVSIGKTLSSREKTGEEWKRLYQHLSSELRSDQNLDSILHLSYNYLPSHLKNCFLYCSMFPEDFRLSRKLLIQLWIAEGFIQERGASTLEEVAEGYIKDLIHRSMLQLHRKNHFGRVSKFRMHDVVRELAISLSRKDNFHAVYKENETVGIVDDTRRLSVIKCSNDKVSKLDLPCLRTFIAFDTSTPVSLLLSSIISKCKYITVLDLSRLPIETVPDAIGDLFNLRYLSLRHSKVKLLPQSIRKLSNLQTLDLFSSKIEKLPRGIVRLTKLRHLYASKKINGGVEIFQRSSPRAPKGLGKLKELQTLVAVEVSDELVESLADLVQLRSLAIYNVKGIHCKELCTSLSQMSSLSRLCLFASDENEVLLLKDFDPPPPHLHRLNLVGQLAKRTLRSPLFRGNNIKHLTLKRTHTTGSSCCFVLDGFPN
ncbi:disease resistance protein RPM1-like [Typha latifolia]|uniref:disease resistance protein RPM1-like n=1 Tax=Typha latifolia TaxID=4733 RepID=UPI003C2E771E